MSLAKDEEIGERDLRSSRLDIGLATDDEPKLVFGLGQTESMPDGFMELQVFLIRIGIYRLDELSVQVDVCQATSG